jgi:hypothetical protein
MAARGRCQLEIWRYDLPAFQETRTIRPNFDFVELEGVVDISMSSLIGLKPSRAF